MAVVNIPSPSGAAYTTYSDVTTADTYMAAAFGAIGDAWRAAVTDDKSRALVSATREIDLMTWASGYPDDTDWLAAIVNASIELAASILEGSLTDRANQASDPTRRLRAGSVELEYFRSLSTPSSIPSVFRSMMAQWLGSGDSVSGSIAFGTDQCTVFDETYETVRGLG